MTVTAARLLECVFTFFSDPANGSKTDLQALSIYHERTCSNFAMLDRFFFIF